MATPVETEFQYNDEFFSNEKHRSRASDEYSEIWFALDPAHIAHTFFKYDSEAKALKKRIYIAGLIIIGLAWLALMLLASESLVFDHVYLLKSYKHEAAIASMFLAIISLIVGIFRFGFSSDFRNWLRVRMLCELVRQWRWCYFISSVDEIFSASGNSEAEEAYKVTRAREFETFLDQILPSKVNEHLTDLSSPLEHVVTVDKKLAYPIDDNVRKKATILNRVTNDFQYNVDLKSMIFSAYERIRLGAQARYTSNQLFNPNGKFTNSPFIQNRWFKNRYVFFGSLVLIAHVIVGVISLELLSIHPWIFYFLAVFAGFTILALRAYEEGVNPGESLGRLRLYHSQIENYCRKYNETTSATTKLKIMKEFEAVSMAEMLSFLTASSKQRFTL